MFQCTVSVSYYSVCPDKVPGSIFCTTAVLQYNEEVKSVDIMKCVDVHLPALFGSIHHAAHTQCQTHTSLDQTAAK